MKNNYSATIDDFLKGKMSEQEENAFKTQIAQDAELKQQVREHLYLIRGIRSALAQKDQSIIHGTRKSQPLYRSWWKMTGIAAAFALLFVVGHDAYYITSANRLANQIAEEMYVDYQITTRGAEDIETTKQIGELFANVRDGKDLEITISQLSVQYTIACDDYVDVVDDYSIQMGTYLAIAYIKNGDTKSAITILQTIPISNTDSQTNKLLQKLLNRFF